MSQVEHSLGDGPTGFSPGSCPQTSSAVVRERREELRIRTAVLRVVGGGYFDTSTREPRWDINYFRQFDIN